MCGHPTGTVVVTNSASRSWTKTVGQLTEITAFGLKRPTERAIGPVWNSVSGIP